jgi:hypothetical protein
MPTERDRIIARVYQEWADERATQVVPDPAHSHTDPSQYTEGIIALSAGAKADAELHRRVRQALLDAGLPAPP